MAVTVDPITDGDFTRLERADAIANWTEDGTVWTALALNTASEVENTGCLEVRVDPGIGSLVASITSRSLENVHLRMWVKLAQSISAGATYGARLIVGTETNHGSWIVYDDANQVPVYNGWMMLVVDPRKPYDAVVGTAPTDILAITDLGCRVDFVDGNGKVLPVGDMIWEGNEVSIEGGTTGARGTFAEWTTDDESNGYGILRGVGGVYYMNAGAVFQGVGTATSFFEDINQLVIFEDLPVSGSLYKFRHVGNATGTNHFQLGTSSGTGVNKEGASGGVMRAAGAAPFRIEAIDTNIDVAAYFGVTMLGPSVLYDDQVRNFKIEEPVSTFTEDTTDFNDAGAGDVAGWASPAVNEAFYFGHDEKFYEINIDTGTAAVQITTVAWEYFNGTIWSALTDLTDGTSAFATTGPQTVTYAMPDNWAKTTVDSDNRYWIRARITAVGGAPTSPVLDEGSVAMSGDIRWEDPACEMIGCVLSGMGSIRVRNGAFLKKCTIDSSRAPTKHAAVDLGGADPASDTVRDLVIQNCLKGILLKGTGNVTYNLRNIKFSNNTNDVRVDFGASDTVTINIVDGGDTPTIDNVNGSTVVISNPVTTAINVKDNLGVNLQNARVFLEASDGTGDFPFEESVTITRSATTATVTHTSHGLLTGDIVVIRGANEPEYNGPHTITVTDANAYTFTVSGAPATPATGTIISTGVIISALTNAGGDVTASRTFTLNQPVKGFIRKSSASPRFKTFPLSGTINNSTGLSINVQMVIDE